MKRRKEATVLFLGVIALGIVGLSAYRLSERGFVDVQERPLGTKVPEATLADDHAQLVVAIDNCCSDLNYQAALELISESQHLNASVVNSLQARVMQRAVERFNELINREAYGEAYAHATDLSRLVGQRDVVEAMLRKAELGLKLDVGNPNSPFKPLQHRESV
ncbi:MAG: hypothetical protein KDA92_17090 [Planctomycetales bacterium]|nr:hypothetical protein [Planctomycetales bacterium]